MKCDEKEGVTWENLLSTLAWHGLRVRLRRPANVYDMMRVILRTLERRYVPIVCVRLRSGELHYMIPVGIHLKDRYNRTHEISEGRMWFYDPLQPCGQLVTMRIESFISDFVEKENMDVIIAAKEPRYYPTEQWK
jgi:hypothetical protein